jgi:hypothetical protein
MGIGMSEMKKSVRVERLRAADRVRIDKRGSVSGFSQVRQKPETLDSSPQDQYI